MQYKDWQIDAVVALKKRGVNHRDIAEQVFGKRTMASSFWYILNEHYYVQKEEDAPKILIFDIETAPEIVFSWGRWKQNTGVSQVIQRSFMLTWAAKWLGDEDKKFDGIPYQRDPTYFTPYSEEDDLEIVSSIWHLLDE